MFPSCLLLTCVRAPPVPPPPIPPPQVFILDSLANFETKDPKDAEKVVERVLPRLQHVNSAVVLSAIKVGQEHGQCWPFPTARAVLVLA